MFAGVDRVLHCGDIGSTGLLRELETLAPVTAVYGNTDGFELRARLPQVVELEFEGLITVVTHGDQFGSPTPLRLRQAFPHAEIIGFGHTHRPVLESVDNTVTIVNPGSAGAARFGVGPSVAVLELERGLPPRTRLVQLSSQR